MTAFAALALYPIWALSLATGLVALRLGRSRRTGLVVLSLLLALWVSGLVLLESGVAIAERVLPAGMLLAGGFVHAGNDLAGVKRPRVLAIGYGWGAIVALLGALAPGLLVRAGAREAGPLFGIVGLLSLVGTALALGYLFSLARRAEDAADRRRRLGLTLACGAGALGGGGTIALRVLGIADLPFAAPFLLLSTVLAAHATFSAERGRARDLVVQGAVQAVMTALLSMVGLTAFYYVLPFLTPDGGRSTWWIAIVVLFASLPLEPLRLLAVERVGRLLFRRATTVPELAASVEASEVRADQAERLAELGRVVAAVAHEIRNPLGVIAAQTKLLERKGADPETLDDVRAQVDRARRFLDDLLRYGKPRPLEPLTFEVQPIVELAAEGLRRTLGDRAKVELRLPGPAPGGPLMIEADRNAFSDVITILLHNAYIEADHVTVTAAREGDAVVVIVEDTGPGVPEALAATLFEPFVTGRGRDHAHPGTGLGLAIAHRWVERHGGTIRYERVAPAGGARFVVRWPRQTG